MKQALTALIFCTGCLLPLAASAQVDYFGKADTLYADIARINDKQWTVTVSYSNDEGVVGLSVPLKLNADSTTRILADSAVYTGGRVEDWAYRGFRPDTAIQAVMLGMIANLGPTNRLLAPGSGRLVTVFVSSVDDKPIEKLTVDTTTLYPANSLLVVADRAELKDENDTVPPHLSKKLEIIPVFVARTEEEE
ncbi:MAG: hypothetical protein AB1744_01740 [Candidatus Zixiibacteriota bacterium]